MKWEKALKYTRKHKRIFYTFFSTSYGNIDWHICIK